MSRRASDAFELWYEREHPRVLASLCATTGDINVASDAADEGFARAWRDWDRVADFRSPVGWVLKVSLNHARSTFRRRAVEHRVLRRVVASEPVAGPAGELWILVEALSRRQREVVVLRYVAQLREREIAEVLGLQRGTISTLLSRALAVLEVDLSDPSSEVKGEAEHEPDRAAG